MNIIFFGSHNYSLYALEALVKAGHKILAVVTQPDKPIGRHQILTPTPVKSWAIKHQVSVLTPKDKNELSQELLLFESKLPVPSEVEGNRDENSLSGKTSQSLKATSKNKIDIGVVSVYGLIIPKEIIDLPKFGCLNIHPSLLPKYRGTIPVPAAIILGEKETGVTIIKMDEKMDHGPILAQEKEKILETNTTENLYNRLFKKGAGLLIKTISSLGQSNNICKASPCKSQFQDDNQASYTRLLKRDYGFIDWKYIQAALEGKNINEKVKIDFIRDNQKNPFYILHSTFYIHNLIRGLSPWPGVWTIIDTRTKNQELRTKKRLKLLKSHIENNRLFLDLVQFEGEKPVPFNNRIIL